MSVSTDEMYNSNSRYLHERYLIHFSSTNVLEVLKSNYLMTSSILEETYKVSSSPFGDITSNELELSLLNLNGIFNPKNIASPYYGLMKRGVKIEAFIRPNEVDEWDPLGVFYVTDWSTSSNGMSAEITARDKLHSILNAPVPSLPIVRNVAFTDFVTDYFTLLGAEVIVDESIQLILPYGFTSGYDDNRRLIGDLMIAAVADCFCLHDGRIVIRSKTAPRKLRATLKDNDQIISVAIKHSLSTDYDSASVTCNTMQEGVERNLLSIESLIVKPGITTTELTKFSVQKVLSVKSIRVESTASVKPTKFTATADNIVCSLQSTSDAEVKLNITGTALDTVASIIATEGTSAVEINSSFVQTTDNANRVCSYSDEYVNEAVPTLDIVVRGNPKIQLGDKIQVDSIRYKTNYVGIVSKVHYTYTGGLTCEMSLTADMTEEV